MNVTGITVVSSNLAINKLIFGNISNSDLSYKLAWFSLSLLSNDKLAADTVISSR
jgi:hypothetical protein